MEYMSNPLKKNLGTSNGMWAIWDYESFKDVDSYQKWFELFCEDDDIAKLVEKNSLVPINLHFDGNYVFEVKVDGELTAKEKEYMATLSKEYFFHTEGKAYLSGIDRVFAEPDEDGAIVLDLPAGDYAISVALINWDEDPDAYLRNGQVSPLAMADFVVLIRSNAEADGDYKSGVDTFVK